MDPRLENPITPTSAAPFQLSGLRVDPAAGEVNGPGGRERLDPKVMDVLVMLARQAGQVVLRDDLLARLWPNVVVTDDVLSRCIYELRRQLSRAGGDDRYRELIETIPKRGYRLTGDVDHAPAPSAVTRPPPAKWRQAAAIATAGTVIVILVLLGWRIADAPADAQRASAAPSMNSIAVLPFVDMSEQKDQGHLSDGIAEEILNRLAQSGDLRVIARTSSFSLRDQPLDVAAIARKLDVTHVLEGSVRKSGDRIRVTAQLIDASSSAHVWSETFDRRLGDVFSVEDEIAASVATALQIALANGTSSGRMPASVEAYESFLQGEFFFHRRAPGDVERAVPHYREAVTVDPRYARAWAALAGAYSNLAWNGSEEDQALQRLQGEAARRAVELDPGLAEAHIRLGQFLGETGDMPGAREHSRIAQALDPDEPMVLADMSDSAVDAGDIEQAIALRRRIVARDPVNPVGRQNLAVLLLASGRLDEAESEYRKVLELNPDAGPDIEIELVRIAVLQGRYSEAYAAATAMSQGGYRDHALALMSRVPEHCVEADAALARLVERRDHAAASIGSDIMADIRLAEVQAFRGMTDAAFATLEQKKRALAQRWGSKLPVVWYFQHEARVSPFLKALHSDPRWTPLVATTG